MGEEVRAYSIVQELCEKGCKSYITGGAVRDLQLNVKPKDFDVVTEATYEQLQKFFANKRNFQTVGKSFEVAIVDGIEVAGYRVDKYNTSNQCVVGLADTLEEDLSRRDLTINSMAFCPFTGHLIDPFGGAQDLKNKIIRFTGNASKRIEEDPCRILRACRFLALLEGEFAEDTLFALQFHAPLIKTVARDRIQKELVKVMKYDKPSLFFRALEEIGILEDVFPSLHNCIGLEGGNHHDEDVFEHCMLVGDAISKKDPIVRLAGFLHDVGKVAAAEVQTDGDIKFIGHEKDGATLLFDELIDLKFSSKDIKTIVGLVTLHMRQIEDVKPKTVRKLLIALDEFGLNWKQWLTIRLADRKGNLAKEPHSRSNIQRFALQFHRILHPVEPVNVALKITDLEVNGQDVMTLLEIKPGAQVGKVLRNLLDKVLDTPELNTREQLTEIILENK